MLDTVISSTSAYISPHLPLILYVLLLITLYWYLTVPKGYPPGPLGLPFIGSSLDTWNAEKQNTILTKWAREYGPVYKVYIGCRMVVVLANWNAVYEALVKKGDIFAGRPRFSSFQPPGIPHNHGIIFSDGQVWKEHRQFAATTLRDLGFGRSILEPRIKEEVNYLISELSQTGGKLTDIEKMVENAVANIICVMLFGRRYEYKDATFKRLLNVLKFRANQSSVGFLSPFLLSPWLASLLAFTPAVQKFKKAGAEFASLIKDETALISSTFDPSTEPTNYIHAFLKHQHETSKKTVAGDSSNFTEAQLVEIGMELFAAGTETTSNTIRWAILYLSHNEEIQNQLYQELRGFQEDGYLPSLSDRGNLPFTEAVIMETQRISNLVPLAIMHRTTADTKLFGYDIPNNTLIAPFLSAVLMDPDTYPEPEIFDPRRFLDDEGNLKKDPKLIPFSAGKRICLGESLAKMELFLFFTGIFLKFRFVFPDDQPKPPIKGNFGFTHIPIAYKICAIPREI